ncbi:MAG: pilus assembly protein [Deltaproteobacteria bacterium]|nr:pilus assembly protein [Deltaproteobacteria bacterium]
MRERTQKKLVRKNIGGQVALETAFVFTFIIFLTFSIINFGFLFHTKNVATYAAFMAARSYQVLGDQTSSGSQQAPYGNGANYYLKDLKTLAAMQTAEDIFTCALPWMSVPDGDSDTVINNSDLEKIPLIRCMEGKRKYEQLNIGVGSANSRSLDFASFKADESGSAFEPPKLDLVAGAFGENARETMRYGILHLRYRTPILFNPFNVLKMDNPDQLVRNDVYVPVLLNPGLQSGLKARDKEEKEEVETVKKK